MNQIKQKIKVIEVPQKKRDLDQDIVRTTFTMPESESEAIDVLRKRIVKENGEILNRSEAVRIGLLALQSLPNSKMKTLLSDLERYRPGRKKKVVLD
jgi:hypothetical protein